jgi:hypothetical protein
MESGIAVRSAYEVKEINDHIQTASVATYSFFLTRL